MAQEDYTFLIADARTFQLLGELPVYDWSFSRKLNTDAGFSGSVFMGDEALTSLVDVRDLSEPGKRIVIVQRNHGDRGLSRKGAYFIWAHDYDTESQVLRLSGSDPLSYYKKRKMPVPWGGAYEAWPVNASGTFPNNDINAFADVSLVLTENPIAMMWHHLNACNKQNGTPPIGFWIPEAEADAITGYNDMVRTMFGYEMHNMGELLENLANTQNGADFTFEVSDPTYTNPDNLINVYMQAGRKDANGAYHLDLGDPDATWQFVFGEHVLKLELSKSASELVTRFWAAGEGEGYDMPIIVDDVLADVASPYQQNVYTAQNYPYPLLEDHEIFSGVVQTTTLMEHNADRLRLFGGKPSYLINVDLLADEFWNTVGMAKPLGDACTIEVPPNADPYFGATGLTALCRIIGYEDKLSSDGDETITLTLNITALM